jgi:hypothetical protein
MTGDGAFATAQVLTGCTALCFNVWIEVLRGQTPISGFPGSVVLRAPGIEQLAGYREIGPERFRMKIEGR